MGGTILTARIGGVDGVVGAIKAVVISNRTMCLALTKNTSLAI